MTNEVNHPSHYTSHESGLECIQITELLNFCRGNAIKYLWRKELKNAPTQDLLKAVWYLKREALQSVDAPFYSKYAKDTLYNLLCCLNEDEADLYRLIIFGVDSALLKAVELLNEAK